MKSYGFNLKLPIIDKNIRVKEITAKEHRIIVKSTYSDDINDFIYYLNSLLEDIVSPEDYKLLTVLDAFLVLLATRAISISPILRLKNDCPETKIQFETSIELSTIIKKIEEIVLKNREINFENIKIKMSSLKMKDSIEIIKHKEDELDYSVLASCIDHLEIRNSVINFQNFDLRNKIEIIKRLPLKTTESIFEKIDENEEELNKIPLIQIVSPATKKELYRLNTTNDLNYLIYLLKLMFSDDLNSMWTINYNLVNKLGYTGEYADSITPAEQYLLLSYYKKEQTEKSETDK